MRGLLEETTFFPALSGMVSGEFVLDVDDEFFVRGRVCTYGCRQIGAEMLKFTVHPLGSTFTPPRVVGERVTRESCSSRTCVRTHVSDLGSWGRSINSVVENPRKQSEVSTESSPSTHGGVDTQSKATLPTTDILSLHCRMCEKPPRVTTQPTVTTRGHLFCSEYILKRLGGVIRTYSQSGA